MQCPQCRHQMKQRSVSNIRFSECPTCSGMWFDQGELDEVKDEVMPEMSWLDIDNWLEQTDFIIRKSAYACPRCKDTTLATIQEKGSLTTIEICPQCEGSWLAAGQFLNLINSLLDDAHGKTVSEYAQMSLQQAKELLTMGDIKDSDWQGLKMVLALLKQRILLQHPKVKSLLVGLQKSLPL